METVTVSFRVPKRVHKALKEMAKENGLYLSTLVERVIYDRISEIEVDDIEKVETTVTIRKEVYELLKRKVDEIEASQKSLLGYLLTSAVETREVLR